MKRPLRFLLYFLLLITGPVISQAQDQLTGTGAVSIGVGSAFQGVQGNFWSLYHNPAGIATLSQATVGIGLERRFLLSEMNAASVGVAFPFGTSQGIGIQASSLGFSAYRESQAGLTYGIHLWDLISIGVAADFFMLSIQDFGQQQALLLTTGVQARLSSTFSLGVTAFNVGQPEITTDIGTTELPSGISAGITYTPTEELWLNVDVQKSPGFEASYRGGLQYALHKHFQARLGVSTAPLAWSGGFGVLWQGLNMDMAVRFTEFLGYTPHFSLSYAFGKSRDE
ncbi:MAG: hypothetical protein AAFR61_16380 [Bacteroidota bacterium]